VPLISLWQDQHPHAPRPAPSGPGAPDHRSQQWDVVVAGGGLTGLTTALLLVRAGRSVVVLEAAYVGAGTTARSTAKISALQGTRLSTIASKQDETTLRAYVDAQLEAVAWLRRFGADHGADHGLDLQERDAVTYATDAEGEKAVRQELDAARAAGLPVAWEDDLPLPFRTRGGVRLADQLQVDPVALLEALQAQAVAHGVQVFEGVRVTAVRGQDPVRVTTTQGELRARHLVVATGTPIVDRGAFFARMEPARSYSVAFRTPAQEVDAMYLSANQPSRSLRDGTHPDGGALLLVGGAGHTTGRARHESERLAQLRAWTAQHYPDAVETHAWSAQDYVPHHGLPFAGPAFPGQESVLVAGGYSKWGMTNAVAASLALSSRILGGHTEWARAFEVWGRRDAAGVGTLLRHNAGVGVEAVRGWGAAVLPGVPDRSPDAPQRPVRERVCTHLGGIVEWNDAESSWDCPLHGSRFADDGTVLDGPAVCGLKRS